MRDMRKNLLLNGGQAGLGYYWAYLIFPVVKTIIQLANHPHVLLKSEDDAIWKGFNDLRQLIGDSAVELVSIEQTTALHAW